MQDIITKIVAVFIKDRKYLVAREIGEDIFKNVGGKQEAGETDMECLRRELSEELNFNLENNPRLICVFPPTPRMDDPNKFIILKCYLVSQQEGLILSPSGEIESLEWIDTKTSLPIPDSIKNLISPKLKELNLID